jgi:hypothetical protein
MVAAAAVFGHGPATADDCSSDLDCEQTGGYNGIIAVVGGTAAVMAAAAAAVAATPREEETDLAIVQVSRDHLEVAPGEPAEVTVTGWHVGKSGSPVRVGMPVRIDAPPGSGITVTPEAGTGELVASIAVDEAALPPGTEQVLLTAQGTWKGKEATATVTVRVTGGYHLRLSSRGQA